MVFGDYDCDGVSATAILTLALRALAPDVPVVPFLPERLSEGYGMSDKALDRLFAAHPDVGLVITVDNGINCIRQVAALKQKGVRVVLTDHHLPGEVIPEADALVNPKVASPKELADLCGAGVAFMLANRLVSEAKRRGDYTGPSVGAPLLVLAGLATVTDLMPLVGQNRILVAEALRRFHSQAPIGLWELHYRAARNSSDRLVSKDFGFLLGPRINAVGRLDSGMKALDLVLECDREQARQKAQKIDEFNVQRKSIEQKMTDEAMEKIVAGAAAQVIDLPDGHQGVAGIVAARVLERLASDPASRGPVPVCVVTRKSGETGEGLPGLGSARAPEGADLSKALKACESVLERFGGHAAAAGFTVKEGKIDEFRKLLCAYCESIRGTVPVKSGGLDAVDLWLDPADLTLEFAEQLGRLEPFGEGNPMPVFGLKGVLFSDARPLGAEGRHLQLSFRNRAIPRAVWWNHGDLVEGLRAGSSEPHDIAFTLEVSDYGSRHVELRLIGLR